MSCSSLTVCFLTFSGLAQLPDCWLTISVLFCQSCYILHHSQQGLFCGNKLSVWEFDFSSPSGHRERSTFPTFQNFSPRPASISEMKDLRLFPCTNCTDFWELKDAVAVQFKPKEKGSPHVESKVLHFTWYSVLELIRYPPDGTAAEQWENESIPLRSPQRSGSFFLLCFLLF